MLSARIAILIFPLATLLITGCSNQTSAAGTSAPPTVEVAQVEQRDVPIYSEWIGNDRQVRALIAEMREVAAQAQQLMLEETQSKAG